MMGEIIGRIKAEPKGDGNWPVKIGQNVGGMILVRDGDFLKFRLPKNNLVLIPRRKKEAAK